MSRLSGWQEVFAAVPRDRSMYFHIHVPKTAGTTMWRILERNFEGHLGADYATGGHPAKYSRRTLEEVIYQWNCTCFTAHNYSLNALPFDVFPNLRAFSFVRDPVSKALSSYSFLRRRRLCPDWHLTRTHTFAEMLAGYDLKTLCNGILFDVPQLDFIVGAGEGGMNMVTALTQAEQFHVFPMERFDDAMLCLEAMFPGDFGDCSYGQRSNEANDAVPDQDAVALAERLPWIPRDMTLHRFACDHLDGLIRQCFPDDDGLRAAREGFARRCEERLRRETAVVSPAPMPMVARIRAAARLLLKGQ
jgi:hypothetical protein